MSSLLQRVHHCAGCALGSQLKAFTMQLPTRLFKDTQPAVLQRSVHFVFSIEK